MNSLEEKADRDELKQEVIKEQGSRRARRQAPTAGTRAGRGRKFFQAKVSPEIVASSAGDLVDSPGSPKRLPGKSTIAIVHNIGHGVDYLTVSNLSSWSIRPGANCLHAIIRSSFVWCFCHSAPLCSVSPSSRSYCGSPGCNRAMVTP